jgi:hypothetical protein
MRYRFGTGTLTCTRYQARSEGRMSRRRMLFEKRENEKKALRTRV